MDAAAPVSSPTPPPPADGGSAPFEGLGQLLELLERASSSLAEGRDGVERHARRLDELEEDATERATGLEDAFDELDESLAAARDGASAALDRWREGADADADSLSVHQQAIADEAAQLDAQVGEARMAVEAGAADAEQALEACEQDLALLDTGFDHWQERLVAALDSVGHAVEEIRARADEAAEEVERHTRDLADETATSLAPRAAAAFEEGRGVLDQAGPALHQAVDGAAQAVTDTFAELAGHGLQAHEQLMSTLADTTASVQDFIAGGGLDLVSQVTDVAIREALQAAGEELAQLSATLVAGQGITAATAPLFPELAVAKKVAEFINDLLEALPGL